MKARLKDLRQCFCCKHTRPRTDKLCDLDCRNRAAYEHYDEVVTISPAPHRKYQVFQWLMDGISLTDNEVILLSPIDLLLEEI